MEMEHKTEMDTKLVKGIVMDHGARHPDMPKKVTDAFILTCNVTLEYEKSEVNSGFFYKSADEREKLVKAERAHCDDKIEQVMGPGVLLISNYWLIKELRFDKDT